MAVMKPNRDRDRTFEDFSVHASTHSNGSFDSHNKPKLGYKFDDGD